MLSFIHRSGYFNKNYQNTYQGITYCLKNRNHLEVDIRVTSDDQFVLFHNPLFLSAATFKKRYPQHPTLTEISEIIAHTKKYIYLDIKDSVFPIQLLANSIASYSQYVFIGTTNTKLLRQLHELREKHQYQYKLVQQINHFSGYKNYLFRVPIPPPAHHLDYLHLFHEWDAAPLPLLKNLHRSVIKYHLQQPHQSQIICGAINSPESAQQLTSIGASGYMPNRVFTV